jgi:hypothetical protein
MSDWNPETGEYYGFGGEWLPPVENNVDWLWKVIGWGMIVASLAFVIYLFRRVLGLG